jgi:hypothetical protein
VPAGDRGDLTGGDQQVHLVGDPLGLAAPVDDHELELTPEDAALAVDLLGGQLRAGLAGRPEDPGRAPQRDHQRDVKVGSAHRNHLGWGGLTPRGRPWFVSE